MTCKNASVIVCEGNALYFFLCCFVYDADLRGGSVCAIACYEKFAGAFIVCKTLNYHSVGKSGNYKCFFGVFVIFVYGNAEIAPSAQKYKRKQPDNTSKDYTDNFKCRLFAASSILFAHNIFLFV